MGLLDSLLDVPERLRVWQMAGVRHFYLDPAAAPGAVSDPVAPAPGDAAVSPEAPCPAASAAALLPPAAAAPDSPCPSDDPTQWPAPWPALFAKAPARPRLVITYRELGLDLTGRADPRRGALWRRLIGDLGLAGQNAVAFWPLALPQEYALVDQPDFFAAGLRLFAPVTVAVFGPMPQAVADALAGHPQTAALRPIPLPHPEELLAGDPEVWDHVCDILAAG
ncbi:hypothetical protein [Solidesulfovibrio sp.]